MPPRYAYWTLLIDDKPTAFRARDREELMPTLQQLKRTNPNIVMRWFARGKLWDSPEQERWAQRNLTGREARTREWRPGGEHKDPRARFRDAEKKRRAEKRQRHHEAKQRRETNQNKPPAPPQGPRPWQNKPAGAPAGERRPWQNKPASAPSGERRPWQNKPAGAPAGERRPWRDNRGKPHAAPGKSGQAAGPADKRRSKFPPRDARGQRPYRKPPPRRPEPTPRPVPEPPPAPPMTEKIVTKPEPPERG